MTSGLFIPPEGAMQFVLHPMRHTRPWSLEAHGISLKRPDFLWVGAGVRCTRSCNCLLSYPVFHEALDPDSRERAKKILSLNGIARSFVCGCEGKVIE